MPPHRRPWKTLIVGAAILLLVLAPPARAHETKGLGEIHLTLGWGDEPAFSGTRNSVEVILSDATGAPVSDPGAELSVEIAFGDQRMALPLRPAGKRPGEFRAWLVPTRAGTYSFHITGTVKGQTVDARSTCSDSTFDCVIDVSEVQFPAKDPSPGQLAERVDRALPRAERALEAAGGARNLAISSMALAALALVAGIGLGMRKGGKGV